MTQPPPLTIVSAQRKIPPPAYVRRTHTALVDLSTPHTGRENERNALGDYLMKSVMKRAAGGVALTMVLIRGFCGGGVFLGYLGIECLLKVFIYVTVAKIMYLYQ